MDFKRLDEEAKADAAAARDKEVSDAARKVEAEARNLADAEEWPGRVVIATLAKPKEQLNGSFSVEFHDDFTGMQTKSGTQREVRYTVSPPRTGSYAALPHHLVVDQHRQMKCTAYSEWQDVPREVKFWGDIDKVTVEDFEGHLAGIIKWWRDKGL